MQLSKKAPDMVDLQMLQRCSLRKIHQYFNIAGIISAGERRQSPRAGEVSEVRGGKLSLALSGHFAGIVQIRHECRKPPLSFLRQCENVLTPRWQVHLAGQGKPFPSPDRIAVVLHCPSPVIRWFDPDAMLSSQTNANAPPVPRTSF